MKNGKTKSNFFQAIIVFHHSLLTLFLMGCFRSLRHKLYNSSTIEILKKNWVLALEGIHVTKCRV